MREAYPNELYHHGIKNQRWGVRRFQYADGSYTPAGRIRYGIFGRDKRKLSKDAKMRAKERTRVKNEEARRDRFVAEADRIRAETEAERAKTFLRDAKRENSLAYKAGSKAAQMAMDSRAQKRAEKEAKRPLSRNAKKLVAAVQNSDNKEGFAKYLSDKKIEKLASKLDPNEYERAVNRINMQMSLQQAKEQRRVQAGKNAADNIRNVANAIGYGTDVWNATAGIFTAFTGKDVPKINTKYTDPLDTLKKKIEVEQKNETLRALKAGADKAESITRQEIITEKQKQQERDDAIKSKKDAVKSAAQEARAKEILEKLKGRRHFGEAANSTTAYTEPPNPIAFGSKIVRAKGGNVDTYGAYKDMRKSRGSDDYSKFSSSMQKSEYNSAEQALNALIGKTGATGVKGKRWDKRDFNVSMDSINVSKKAKTGRKIVESIMGDSYNASPSLFYNLNDYREKVEHPEHYDESALANNTLMTKSKAKNAFRNFNGSNFDVSRLPKEQQKLFFAMLNSKMR